MADVMAQPDVKDKFQAKRWDIFCAVVDNFGDIGICWRLSRQLAKEHATLVTLWVDDLLSFKAICPQVQPELKEQTIEEIRVCLWSDDTNWRNAEVPAVVIEALACNLPKGYQQRISQHAIAPLWINLEYLSAELWVEGCHQLPSPQADSALEKYFFFPGFSDATGGLLCEAGLCQQADEFAANTEAKHAFWQQLGVANAEQYAQIISLFAYDHPNIASIISLWQQQTKPILVLVPKGTLAQQLTALYPELASGQWQKGSLTLNILPFMPQQQYDKLLWACDINFVRGEDSVIRAHWAGKPFIWQIYRQQDDVHLDKLNAFMQRYLADMPKELAESVRRFWLNWNTDAELAQSWQDFVALLAQISDFNRHWRTQLLANGDLASNLVHFVEKKFIMRRNFS